MAFSNQTQNVLSQNFVHIIQPSNEVNELKQTICELTEKYQNSLILLNSLSEKVTDIVPKSKVVSFKDEEREILKQKILELKDSLSKKKARPQITL